ncbi:MAG: DUF3379 family protein [Pseudomonadota bacterium]
MSSSDDNKITGDPVELTGMTDDGLSFDECLGAEPRRVADAVRSAQADGVTVQPEQLAAIDAAETLEDRIESTLRSPAAPAGLIDDVLKIPEAAPVRRGPPAWLALAASVLLMVGVASVSWYASRPAPGDIAQFVENHFRMGSVEGEALMARASGNTTPEQVARVLASVGASASDELSRQVRYIKICPTPNSMGAQMVFATEDGPATVIIMPEVSIEAPMFVSFDGVEADVIRLQEGSAAIIGAGEEVARELRASLEAGIRPMGTDT